MASLAANVVPMGAGHPDLGRPVDRDAMFRLCTLLAVSRCLYPLWPCVDSAPAVPASGDAALRLWDFLRVADENKFLGHKPPTENAEFVNNENWRPLDLEYLYPVVRSADDKLPDLQWQIRGACRYRVWWELFNRAMQQLVDAPGMVPVRRWVVSSVGSGYALVRCRGRAAVPLDETGLLTDGWIDDLTYGTPLSQVTCCRNDYDQTRVAPAQGAAPIGSPILPTLADEWLETFLGYRLLPSDTPGVVRRLWRIRSGAIGLNGWLPDDWDSRKAADGAQYADMVRRVGGVRRAPWRGDAEPSFSWRGPDDYPYLTQLLSPWTGRGTTPTDPAAPPVPVEWDSDFPYHGLCALESLLEHMEMDSEGLMMYTINDFYKKDSEGYTHDGVVCTDTSTEVDFEGDQTVAVGVLPPGSGSGVTYTADVTLARIDAPTRSTVRRDDAAGVDRAGWSRAAGGGVDVTGGDPDEGPYVEKTLYCPRVWFELPEEDPDPGDDHAYVCHYDISDLPLESKAFWRGLFEDPDFDDYAGDVVIQKHVDVFLGVDRAWTWNVHVHAGASVAVSCRGSDVRVDPQWCRLDMPLSSAVRSRPGLVQSLRHVFFLQMRHDVSNTSPQALADAVSEGGQTRTYSGVDDAELAGCVMNGPHARIRTTTPEGLSDRDVIVAFQSAFVDANDRAVRRSAAALQTCGFIQSGVAPDEGVNKLYVRDLPDGGDVVVPVKARVTVNPAVWNITYPTVGFGAPGSFVCEDGGTVVASGSAPDLFFDEYTGPGRSYTVSAGTGLPTASLDGYVVQGGGFFGEQQFYNLYGYSAPVSTGGDDLGFCVTVARFAPGRIS